MTAPENSLGRENIEIRRILSERQLNDMRKEFTVKMARIADLEEEEAARRKEISDEIKRLKDEALEELTTIRRGFTMGFEDVWVVRGITFDEVDYVDSKGEVVGSRPAKPNEMQATIFDQENAAGAAAGTGGTQSEPDPDVH